MSIPPPGDADAIPPPGAAAPPSPPRSSPPIPSTTADNAATSSATAKPTATFHAPVIDRGAYASKQQQGAATSTPPPGRDSASFSAAVAAPPPGITHDHDTSTTTRLPHQTELVDEEENGCCGWGSHSSSNRRAAEEKKKKQKRKEETLEDRIARLREEHKIHRDPKPYIKENEEAVAPVPVYANVYHLVDEKKNSTFKTLGFGLFHSGIEVFGEEWSFGTALPSDVTGVFRVVPMEAMPNDLHAHIYLGDTTITKEKFMTLIFKLMMEWQWNDYHVLNRNCNHFCAHLCLQLSTVQRLKFPDWINRASNAADWVVPKALASKVVEQVNPPTAEGTAGAAGPNQDPTKRHPPPSGMIQKKHPPKPLTRSGNSSAQAAPVPTAAAKKPSPSVTPSAPLVPTESSTGTPKKHFEAGVIHIPRGTTAMSSLPGTLSRAHTATTPPPDPSTPPPLEHVELMNNSTDSNQLHGSIGGNPTKQGMTLPNCASPTSTSNLGSFTPTTDTAAVAAATHYQAGEGATGSPQSTAPKGVTFASSDARGGSSSSVTTKKTFSPSSSTRAPQHHQSETSYDSKNERRSSVCPLAIESAAFVPSPGKGPSSILDVDDHDALALEDEAAPSPGELLDHPKLVPVAATADDDPNEVTVLTEFETALHETDTDDDDEAGEEGGLRTYTSPTGTLMPTTNAAQRNSEEDDDDDRTHSLGHTRGAAGETITVATAPTVGENHPSHRYHQNTATNNDQTLTELSETDRRHPTLQRTADVLSTSADISPDSSVVIAPRSRAISREKEDGTVDDDNEMDTTEEPFSDSQQQPNPMRLEFHQNSGSGMRPPSRANSANFSMARTPASQRSKPGASSSARFELSRVSLSEVRLFADDSDSSWHQQQQHQQRRPSELFVDGLDDTQVRRISASSSSQQQQQQHEFSDQEGGDDEEDETVVVMEQSAAEAVPRTEEEQEEGEGEEVLMRDLPTDRFVAAHQQHHQQERSRPPSPARDIDDDEDLL